jgi:hypothetical protein
LRAKLRTELHGNKLSLVRRKEAVPGKRTREKSIDKPLGYNRPSAFSCNNTQLHGARAVFIPEQIEQPERREPSPYLRITPHG